MKRFTKLTGSLVTCLVVAVIMIENPSVAGLKCYECNGRGCEYMDKKKLKIMECSTEKREESEVPVPEGAKYLCAKGVQDHHVYRVCTYDDPDIMNSTITVGCRDGHCYCDTDLCNGSFGWSASIFFSIGLATLTAFVNYV